MGLLILNLNGHLTRLQKQFIFWKSFNWQKKVQMSTISVTLKLIAEYSPNYFYLAVMKWLKATCRWPISPGQSLSLSHCIPGHLCVLLQVKRAQQSGLLCLLSRDNSLLFRALVLFRHSYVYADFIFGKPVLFLSQCFDACVIFIVVLLIALKLFSISCKSANVYVWLVFTVERT